MEDLDNFHGNEAGLRARLAEMTQEELVAQELISAGGLQTIQHLLKVGVTTEQAAVFCKSLARALVIIHDEQKNRGIQPIFK